jgi:hypothetical protein
MARYYPSLENQFVRYAMLSSTVDYSTGQWKGFNLSLAANLSYRPYVFDSQQLFSQEGAATDAAFEDADIPYLAESYLIHSEHVMVTRRLAAHTTVNGKYAYRGARGRGDKDRFGRQSYGGQLNHTLSKGLGVHMGYMRRDVITADESLGSLHVIDIGASYNRALSFSRRTSVSFSTGSTGIRRNEQLMLRARGHVQLTHEIGRTWSAFAGYHRSVVQSEVWDDVVEADGVTAGVGGLVNRRLQLSFTARGVLGRTGVQPDAPGFDSVRTALSAGYALHRLVNLMAVYGYYHHKFDDPSQLAINLPSRLDRQIVRVGVTVWFPVFKTAGISQRQED